MLLSRMDTPVMRGGSVTQTLRSVGRSSSVGLPVTLRRNSTKFGHRSRVDLGSISVGSRISGRSRVDLGSTSGRSRVDLESTSSRSRLTEIKITSSSSDLPVKSIGRVSLLRSKLNLPIDFTGRSEELLVILISVDRDRLEIVPRSEIRLRS